MSKTDDRIKEIRQQQIGNTGKRVLVLEGKDDVAAFENFLNKVNPDWENVWVLAHAGKKTEVLAIIKQEANWIGVVDRDEWSADKIEGYQTELTNLWILPRYCIENYLIVPEELWQALPSRQQSKIAGGLQVLDQTIKADLGSWCCHGVLWSVINPLWEGLRAKGFKEALLDPAIATNDEQIKNKLAEWHHYLEPEQIWQQYQQALANATQKNADEQLMYCVHGKFFFAQIVTPVLNQLLIQESADKRKRQQEIFKILPVPADLDPLWQKMGL